MISANIGLTRIKDETGWNPLRNLWTKIDPSTWTPVQKAWTKTDSTTWTQIYPTPRGNLTVSSASLTYNLYQHYTEYQKITLTNTGNYPLTVQNIYSTDTIGYTTQLLLETGGVPLTMQPGDTRTLDINVTGVAVGTTIGNINLLNNIGYLGWANISIPVTTTVLANYSSISTLPSRLTIGQYYLDPQLTGNLTMVNTGNGATLQINNVNEPNGVLIFSNTADNIGFNFNTFQGNTADVTWRVSNNSSYTFGANTVTSIAPGTALIDSVSDNLIIYNSSDDSEHLVPYTLNVITPTGEQDYTTPGDYSFVVPDYVHQLVLTAVGGGGGGGGGEEVGVGGAGGGGGSGDYSTQTVSVIPGETLTVTVGAGGAASRFVGRTTNAPGGSDGGTTIISGSFGTITVAGGFGGGGASSSDTNSNSGKIICTKLYELGLMSKEIYLADQAFGAELVKSRPDIYNGYRAWAEIVVDWMDGNGPNMMPWLPEKRRREITRRWSTAWAQDIATPWAEEMAREMGIKDCGSLTGRMITLAGIPICKAVGVWQRVFGSGKKPPGFVKGAMLIPVFILFKIVAKLGRLIERK